MKKTFIITAPLSSTKAERDEIVDFLTKKLDCVAICLLEGWRVEMHDVPNIQAMADEAEDNIGSAT